MSELRAGEGGQDALEMERLLAAIGGRVDSMLARERFEHPEGVAESSWLGLVKFEGENAFVDRSGDTFEAWDGSMTYKLRPGAARPVKGLAIAGLKAATGRRARFDDPNVGFVGFVLGEGQSGGAFYSGSVDLISGQAKYREDAPMTSRTFKGLDACRFILGHLRRV